MTKCRRCKKVLTDERGVRIESAIFDSSLTPVERSYLLAKREAEHRNGTVWALCEECWEIESKGTAEK